jgi:hypothetical protein
MVPETSQRRALELYRAPVFPGEFKWERTLLKDVIALDPTIVKVGDRHWLFANDHPRGGNPHDTLNLFWSESFLGPWHPHAHNPVVKDIRRARPAGNILEVGSQLLRPAQDCSRRYGHSVVFNRIERLDPQGYREKEVLRVTPEWLVDNAATHTYNRDSLLEVVDGQWLTFETRSVDLIVGAVARLLKLPTASAIRGRRGWAVSGQEADRQGDATA